MVIHLGSLVQFYCRDGGTLQINITGMSGECSQCLGHTGLPPFMACVLSQLTVLRLQVALQGHCLKQALGCMHFPGLSHSDSGSWYSTKAQTRLGWRFVSFPGLSSSGDQLFGEHTLLRWGSASYHLICPSCSVSWVHSRSTVSGVQCVSSWELISGCSSPGGCQPSRIPGSLC